MKINSTNNQIVLISDMDIDVATISWTVIPHRNTYYAMRTQNNKCTYLHRVIMEKILERPLLSSEKVDHRDRNGINNQRENLRLATSSQNQQNAKLRIDNKSGYRGVSFNKQYGKWQAVIYINKERFHLGIFDTPELASLCYEEKARNAFGEFYNGESY